MANGDRDFLCDHTSAALMARAPLSGSGRDRLITEEKTECTLPMTDASDDALERRRDRVNTSQAASEHAVAVNEYVAWGSGSVKLTVSL